MTQTLALLTEEDAAQKLHLSPRTLRALRSAGKIRYVRISPRQALICGTVFLFTALGAAVLAWWFVRNGRN